MSKTTWGTSYFVSINAAIRYYRPYGIPPMDVRDKVKDGEIHIGKPPVKPGETLTIIDNGTRYAITSEDK